MSLPHSHTPNPAAARPDPEETLRQIARLPAPAGLEERVLERLARTPPASPVLPWPRGREWMHSKFARGAAAAAIVCFVTGGGWAVYSRVTPPPAPRLIVLPATGGFSSANAVRTPKTLEGPTLHSEAVKPPAPATPRRAGAHRKHGKNLALPRRPAP